MKKSISSKKTVLFFDNQASAFVSHRLPLAVSFLREGFEVHVAAPPSADLDNLSKRGFRVHHLRLGRRSVNPVRELLTIFDMVKTLREVDPDLVHFKSPKFWMYGGLLTRFIRARYVVISHVVGLGYSATGVGPKAMLVRILFRIFIRAAFNCRSQRVIVQNSDDYEFLNGCGCDARKLRLVRGSGVDLAEFPFLPLPEGLALVVLPARMLIDKGVREFCEAAMIIRRENLDIRFALVGGVDSGNPMSLRDDELKAMTESGVEWWGHCVDMVSVYAQAHLVCLPSWREGLPKVLLEAMACGRAVIAADTPGTREPVLHERNGLLVPVRNPEALARAILTLIGDRTRLSRMGLLGRELVQKEFSTAVIVEMTMRVAEEVLLYRRKSIVSA